MTYASLVEPIDVIVGRAESLRDQATHAGAEGFLSDLGKILTAARTFSSLMDRVAPPATGAGAALFLTPVVRHDLLNPVNQIIGYAEMLIEESQDEAAAVPTDDLERIVAAARDLSDRIDVAAGRKQAGADASGGSAAADDLVAVTAEATPQSVSAPTDYRMPAAAHPLLVVDDDELNRDLLTKRLERYGFDVLVAEDGLRALEILETQPIDLVLLDVLMPKMDGYQVLARIKENPALNDVPVLMVSGLSEIESVVRCIAMGATDYLFKPFNPVLLQARIGACLEKKQLRDQERRTFQALKTSQEALAAELAEAADYVRSLLPPPIKTAEVEVDWRFIPSTQLGGDAFGHQWLDEDHLALYLFDVCGHGVGAALLSVSVIDVLRSARLRDIDRRNPALVLQALNDTFPMELHNGQYFTIWYGVYDRQTRRLEYASGGHPPAVLLTNEADDRPATALLSQPGLFIGGMAGTTYRNGHTAVPPGSLLYIFSDGLYEIPTPSGAMLTYDAFVRMFAAAGDSQQSPLDRVIAELRSVQGVETFEDDVSVMEIRFA